MRGYSTTCIMASGRPFFSPLPPSILTFRLAPVLDSVALFRMDVDYVCRSSLLTCDDGGLSLGVVRCFICLFGRSFSLSRENLIFFPSRGIDLDFPFFPLLIGGLFLFFCMSLFSMRPPLIGIPPPTLFGPLFFLEVGGLPFGLTSLVSPPLPPPDLVYQLSFGAAHLFEALPPPGVFPLNQFFSVIGHRQQPRLFQLFFRVQGFPFAPLFSFGAAGGLGSVGPAQRFLVFSPPSSRRNFPGASYSGFCPFFFFFFLAVADWCCQPFVFAVPRRALFSSLGSGPLFLIRVSLLCAGRWYWQTAHVFLSPTPVAFPGTFFQGQMPSLHGE